MDIYPTLAELAGLDVPGEVQGKSLVSIMKDPSRSVREAALSLNNKSFGLRGSRWAYMRYSQGEAELYDMDSDATELVDLAGQYPELVEEMVDNWQQWEDRTMPRE